MNMKGGVGKTTIACHYAAMSVRENLGRPKSARVLLIDYDPQFNASQMFIPHAEYFKLEEEDKTTLAILMDHPEKVDPFSLQQIGVFPPPSVGSVAYQYDMGAGRRMDLVPSTLKLMYLALGQPNKSIVPIKTRFREFILSASKSYDLVVIDCHPAGSIFTETALSCSNHVLIPVKPEEFAVRGVGIMKEFIDGRGPQNSPIKPHIVFNNVPSGPRTSFEDQIRGDPRFGKHCLRNRVRYWTHLTRPSQGKRFVWSNPVSHYLLCQQNLRDVFSELNARIAA
jgi:chromosome partitioning protein